MEQLFGKTITDVVRASRNIQKQDQLTFLSQLTLDVKQDFNNKTETVRQQALLKLFFLAMEGTNVKWAEFNVINSMGSASYLTKRLAFLTIHLVLDSQSQGLIMVTNLFKKELSNVQNLVQLSTALSCVGNICNKDLSETIVQLIVNLQSHSKPLIRKKALAILAKIFSQCPHLIPNNLEKVIHKLSTEETNTNVLACGVSIMSQVLKVTPSLYPLFVKFIFEQLQKQKSNWLIIKLIRISNRIMQIEPRFQKKLIDPIAKLLSQTHSLSLRFELIFSILKYFKDQQNLYDNAIEVLKTFIGHSDANLRSLGLDCLTQMLKCSPESLVDFQDQLQESFKNGDHFYKIQIMDLFHDHTTPKNFNQIIHFLLQAIDKEGNTTLRQKLIETIILISQKNKFANVHDPEQLFLIHIPQIITKVENHETAQKLRDFIFELLSRIPELYLQADTFCSSVFKGFESKNPIDQSNCVIFQVIRDKGLKKETPPRETLYKALFLIISESTRYQGLSQLVNNLLLVSQMNSLIYYKYSIPEVHSMLFKFIVSISRQLQDSQKKHEQVIDIVKYDHEDETDVKKMIFKWVMVKYFTICQQIHSIESTRTLNIYQKVIFQTFGILYPETFQQFLVKINEDENIEKVCRTLISNTDGIIKEFAKLGDFFDKNLPLIHQDAQKYVKIPDGLDLSIPFSIDVSEVEMIKNINDNTNHVEQNEQTQKVTVTDKIITAVANIEIVKSSPVIQESEKPKKEFKIIRDEQLPPGVTQKDLIQIEDE